MATAKDIARIAGVSIATVSNVLNGKHGAAGPAKTREIIDLAKSLHYQPNSLAKSLKKQKTNSIGVITEDLTVFNAPEIVDGIEAFCEEQGYEIILLNMRLFKRYKNNFTDTPKHEILFDKVVSTMAAKQVEGIIYVGYHCREIKYKPKLLSIPFVYTYCFSGDAMYPSVMVDDENGAYQVMEYLLGKGHRKIGIIAGPQSSRNSELRMEGCRKALKKLGMSLSDMPICYGDWSRESGYNNADRLLDAHVTAVFCFNDMMANGLYRKCAERNIVPGKDLAVFGYDDNEICSATMPELSSVAPPLGAMGQASAEIIFSRLGQHKSADHLKLLPCQLKIRASAR